MEHDGAVPADGLQGGQLLNSVEKVGGAGRSARSTAQRVACQQVMLCQESEQGQTDVLGAERADFPGENGGQGGKERRNFPWIGQEGVAAQSSVGKEWRRRAVLPDTMLRLRMLLSWLWAAYSARALRLWESRRCTFAQSML